LGPILVTYPAVLAIVPTIHSVPPFFPPLSDILHERTTLEPDLPLPEDGFDMILHLGAGRNGAVSMETLGHGRGYTARDVQGGLPPLARVAGQTLQGIMSEAERFERERMHSQNVDDYDGGYGEGYECFPGILETEVDVQGLMTHLGRIGEKRVKLSTDAGHFLCDYICYGSLAESQRPLFDAKQKNRKRAKTLFMHVPYDMGQPFEMHELVRIVREVVCWVCTGEGDVQASTECT